MDLTTLVHQRKNHLQRVLIASEMIQMRAHPFLVSAKSLQKNFWFDVLVPYDGSLSISRQLTSYIPLHFTVCRTCYTQYNVGPIKK